MAFIQAFEALVISAVKSLDKLAAMEFLRIRFIDLESQVPALNPYFQLQDNHCTGIWSDPIVDNLRRTRPYATFAEKADTLSDVGFKDGQLFIPGNFSKTRPQSIKISSYSTLMGGITIT
ncbi:hypothetical protein M7I_7469 [Glarea lozoyensis 74030]|nr:hypothetical protein M7I_7469 [Glarea lozoyensis 74030]